MPEISVNIEVYCAACGAGLCNQTEAVKTRGRAEQSFRVTPCEHCLEEARDAGDRAGYDRGLADGKAEAQP